MKFINFSIFYLVLPLVALLLYAWAAKSKRRAMKRIANKKLLAELSDSFDRRKRNAKAVLVVAAIFFIATSFMRPTWGFRWQEIKRKGLDIIIALDVSKSMLAEDVKPNRLARSKLAIEDFVKKLKGDRIGLVAFSGTAFLQCPLTVDYNGFLLALNAIKVGIIPRGGTSISSAIYEAFRSYEGGLKENKVLIIITDGEDLEGDVKEAAERAAKDGVIIYCVGIGTREGEIIPVQNESGKVEFVKDEAGNVVKSSLNEDVLKSIALATGGSYVRATPTDFGLNFLYDEKISSLEKREIESKMKKHYEERFQIPLVIALLLLLIEPFINERRRR